jgi:transcriptional regulator with XRE-family HTH domain
MSREKAKRAALLKKVGLKIARDLYTRDQSVDALALEIGMARSTLREIIAGRSNPRLLTLDAVAQGLGYRDLGEFFSDST